MSLKEKMVQMCRNSLSLMIEGEQEYQLCGTRFGGRPDVPPDFVWPVFEGEDYDGELQERPLSFLAQFNCGELSAYDSERLLPDHGLLSFFYQTELRHGDLILRTKAVPACSGLKIPLFCLPQIIRQRWRTN